MEKHLLLGIDIGTSGCKLTIFDFQGNALASTNQDYNTYYPHPGWAEQDANEWWQAVCQGLRYLAAQHNIDTGAIAAIGVDGQGWACIPVDVNGIPLRKVMIWLDRRSAVQARWMKERCGERRLIQLSGNPVDPAYLVPKILWLKENEPQVYRETHQFLQSNSYIVFKLTGQYSQDYSQGYGFHFFNISTGYFEGDVAEEMGISQGLTAPLHHSHSIVGTVSKKAAAETGLHPGTPVVAGGLDAACCSLGAGVVKPGQTQEQGGQAGGMSIQVDRPLIHPRLILGYHVIPEQWLLQGGTVGGGSLRWFKESFGYYEQLLGKEQGMTAFEVMSEEALGIAAGSDGLIFLPYMAGERSPIWDSTARGILFGLSYEKTRAHVIRAIMEGVGFSLLHNLRTAEEVNAYAGELTSVGGAANSYCWTQIKADITGKRIQVPYSDHATTLGAALLAGLGAGIYKDAGDAVNSTVRLQRIHEPNAINHQVYEQYYSLYLDLYEKNKESFRKLGILTRE